MLVLHLTVGRGRGRKCNLRLSTTLIRYEGVIGFDSIPYHILGGVTVLKERFAGRPEFRLSMKVALTAACWICCVWLTLAYAQFELGTCHKCHECGIEQGLQRSKCSQCGTNLPPATWLLGFGKEQEVTHRRIFSIAAIHTEIGPSRCLSLWKH